MPRKSKERIAAERAAQRMEFARDAGRAMEEYQAERLAVAAKTARLRALRLASEKAEKPSAKGTATGKSG